MSTFQKPRKAILSKEQLARFQASQCHKDIVFYIESPNASVLDVKPLDDGVQPLGIAATLCLLDRAEELVADIPLVDNKASRFGNPAFRAVYDRVLETSRDLRASLPSLPEDAIPEVSTRLEES